MRRFGKKLFALVLALMCVATVGIVSASAAERVGSWTISHPTSGRAGKTFSTIGRNNVTGDDFVVYKQSPVKDYQKMFDYGNGKSHNVYSFGIKQNSFTPELIGVYNASRN